MGFFDATGNEVRIPKGSRVAVQPAWIVLASCFCFLSLQSVHFAQEPVAEKPKPGGTASPAATSAAAPAGTTAATPPETESALAKVQPWEYSPYQIRVWLAAAAAPEFNPVVLDDLQQDLYRRADSVVGAPWTVTIEPPPEPLASTLAYAPETLTTDEVAKNQKAVLQGDKLIWVSLQANAREMQVRAREFDCHTRSWGHPYSQVVRQPAALNQAVFDAMLAVFSPLARIEEGQGKTCIVRTKAGGLALSQDSPTWIGTGDVLLPVFRQNDRYGEPLPNRIQVVPFTFLQVTAQNPNSPSLLDCLVHSSMRSPIHGRPTSRRERWALKVRPFLPATELIIEGRPNARTDPKVRLAGLEIYAKTPLLEAPKAETEEERLAAEKKNPPELMGITDWRGMVTIPNRGQGLRLMYIKNGGLLLARLPMLVGLEERLVAEVPDDDPRLQAEGFVKGLNGDITDLVIQRQLIRVRVRRKIAEGKFDDAQRILDELRDMKTMHDLQRTLDQQIARQRPSTNAAVRQRIEKLYADERELIAKHVDVDILNQLTAELAAAKANPKPAESQAAKGNAAPKSAAVQTSGGANPQEPFRITLPTGANWQVMHRGPQAETNGYMLAVVDAERSFQLTAVAMPGMDSAPTLEAMKDGWERGFLSKASRKKSSGDMTVGGRQAYRVTAELDMPDGQKAEVVGILIVADGRNYVLGVTKIGENVLDEPEVRAFIESFEIVPAKTL